MAKAFFVTSHFLKIKNVVQVISNEKNAKRFMPFFVNEKRDKCDVYLSVGGDRVICGHLS